MSRDGVVKAELKTTQESSSLQKWEIPAADVIVNPRETRSSKPEFLYHFSPAARSVLVQQPISPQSSGEASGFTPLRSTSPLEHLITSKTFISKTVKINRSARTQHQFSPIIRRGSTTTTCSTTPTATIATATTTATTTSATTAGCKLNHLH